jgi:hypothetical protein
MFINNAVFADLAQRLRVLRSTHMQISLEAAQFAS